MTPGRAGGTPSVVRLEEHSVLCNRNKLPGPPRTACLLGIILVSFPKVPKDKRLLEGAPRSGSTTAPRGSGRCGWWPALPRASLATVWCQRVAGFVPCACLSSPRTLVPPGMPGDAWRVHGICMWPSRTLYSRCALLVLHSLLHHLHPLKHLKDI